VETEDDVDEAHLLVVRDAENGDFIKISKPACSTVRTVFTSGTVTITLEILANPRAAIVGCSSGRSGRPGI